jgi:hypothetical protein
VSIGMKENPPKMKATKLLCVSTLVVLFVALAVPSWAQVVANDAYQVNYYSGGVGTLRVINTGQVGSPIDTGTNHGKVCADIYVFDSNQEMLACCSCPITANGLLTVSGTGLLFNPLTGIRPATGVIKIVADNQPGKACDPKTIINPVESGLRAWETHPQGAALTETVFANAPLTNTEQSFLGQACSFVWYLGSGKGVCTCPKAG